jgi:hypothetical protein
MVASTLYRPSQTTLSEALQLGRAWFILGISLLVLRVDGTVGST